MATNNKLRQPIVTVCGHVDHGKTSILDCFRDTCFQDDEAGGITQKISFTKFPLGQIKSACPIIEKSGIKLDIPGFLFIDTPGHAAFTSLRKIGGSLADLAIVVISIKEGIKPQTAEVFQILRANKTPFLIALNKIDSISGWQKNPNLKESIENQVIHAKQEFEEAFLTFQGSLSEHGFESDIYFNVLDFTKKIAIVPCSAKTGEGIPELLLVLCGLSQKFLKERLKMSEEAKGVILEVKKDKNMEYAEAIIYDGFLDEGDELVVANFSEPQVLKVRAISEILPLCNKYKSVKSISAAAGVRIQFADKAEIISGMPFEEVNNNIDELKIQMKKDFASAIKLDKQGIIVKADSLGSLEALLTLLRQEKVQVIKAGIGPIGKTDIMGAKANMEINPLDSIIVGFNVKVEEEIETYGMKILTNEVVYKLIEDLQEWRKKKQSEIEKERILGLATIGKAEILHKYVFRNSNPAIFGVKMSAGKFRVGLPLINDRGEEVARIKSLQVDKSSVNELNEGQEAAIALPGVTFDRQLNDVKFLYTYLGEKQIKEIRKNEDLMSGKELRIVDEVAEILSKKD